MTISAEYSHEYSPRGSCLEIFSRQDPEILLSGPAGTGKSMACLEKLHLICLATPGVRGLIVRKTQASMTSTALVTWREKVVAQAIEAGVVDYYGGSQQEPAQYRYPNGARIMLGGMDNPTKIMSSDYDLIYVQELIELTEADWDALSSRLRNGKLYYQQLFGDTNPDSPEHWIKRRESRGDLVILESRHSDNPVLVDDEGRETERGAAYLARLGRLTGVRKSRLKHGLWVSAEGAIYEEYDSAVHLIDRFDIPEDWPRYWSVDFGFVHPFVLQCWAVDGDGRMYLYRELYGTRRRVQQWARDILREVTDPQSWTDANGNDVDPLEWVWTEPQPDRIVADHDAEGRDTLESEIGIGTVAADKRVIDGIQAVQGRLAVEDDGRPRIFFMRDSVVRRDPELVEARRPTCTTEEFGGYVWDLGAGRRPREQPRKIEDDGMDATRYMVMELSRGGVNVRWM